MIHDTIHRKIVENRARVDSWFRTKSTGLSFPFYSSFDIRDSGVMIAPVDANIFPAGFNNICLVDRERAVDIVRKYLDIHYGPKIEKIALLTEEHTTNLFYWDNVAVLFDFLNQSGHVTKIAFPRALKETISLTNAAGRNLKIFGAEVVNGQVVVDGEKIDLVICNNDFSHSYEGFVKDLKTPMNPPHTMGWHRRRKSEFFDLYNRLAFEFAEIIDIPTKFIQVDTELFPHFDLANSENLENLATSVDNFLERLAIKYEELGIKQKPFAFIKNNAGTYGLGVVHVNSGNDVREWNYKARKKMKAAKGGREIVEVIIQEGIPTRIVTESETAEPSIYMIGCHLAGGFLRAHSKKGPNESLNSPGVVFKKLCVSDLRVAIEGASMENVYGWLAKLGFLAIAYEAKQSKVEFVGYKAGCSL
ncbi:MAG: glutamate--cysteine ligase [Bdellovibrionales bacterium]|nr:glutamate--cysteine ligase [Bdellovibrionales bacterium]